MEYTERKQKYYKKEYVHIFILEFNTLIIQIWNITIEPSLKYANETHVNWYINKVYVSTKKKKKKNEMYGYK